MTIGIDRRAVHAAATDLVASRPRLADALTDGAPPPAAVDELLAELARLVGVPFNALVADESLLPPESIRFFQVDPDWIHALLDGALSVGVATGAELAHDAVQGPTLRARAVATARTVRSRLVAGRPPSAADATSDDDSGGDGSGDVPLSDAPVTGFLLRSQVVTGWPNLEVSASDATGAPLTLVRLDVLPPATLLALVDGVVAQVDIHEPSEGLHFGFDVGGGKLLRYVTVPAGAGNAQPGSPIGDDTVALTAAEIPMRGFGVIDVTQLASTIQAKLVAVGANNAADGTARPFTSAEFALQMVEGAESVVFVNQPVGTGEGS